jgi:pyrroline-5-carboxylate reductase
MTFNLDGQLVLIGAGKMGGAMLEGWLRAGLPGAKLVAIDPAPSAQLLALAAKHGIGLNIELAAIGAAQVIVVAVKPQMFDVALFSLGPLRQSSALVVSIVAGKTIASLERHFGSNTAVVRAMPNTPAAVGRGITALTASRSVSTSQLALAKRLMSAVGDVVTVEREEQIDTVTAVSGSGPAYVFYLTECLAGAGQKLGLSEEVATTLARATVAGSGELMRLSGLSATALRHNVTSPGGTTHAALQILMSDDGLRPLLERAVAAATDRSRELAD